MLTEELRRLVTWSERHRRLLARIIIAFCLSLLVDLAGAKSSLKNPVTHAGQTVDVVLEFWAVFVETSLAGSFASFFLSGDQSSG